MDKRKITLSVIAIAVLLVVLVGSTYAYWTLNGAPKVSANVQVQTGGLILRLDDTEGSITTNDVIDPNHLSFSKYFNITNESAADGYAKVLFKGLTNTFVTDALVYDLEEVQSDKTSYTTPRMIITNEVVPKVNNTNATLVDGLLIEKGTLSGNTVTPNTKYYKITVRYKYSDTVNQNEDLNKTLVSGFTLEEGQSSVSMTLSFNTNDNSVNSPTSKTVTLGETYGELPKPKKTRYILEGWYTDNLYTEKVESESKILKSGNHTLYAKWEETKLPDGYTQLEYLGSTKVQYIDTDLSMPSGFFAEFDYMWNEYEGIILGAEKCVNGITSERNLIGEADTNYGDNRELILGIDGIVKGPVPTLNRVSHYEISTIYANPIFKIDDTNYPIVAKTGLPLSPNITNLNLYLMADNKCGGGTYNSYGRIYNTFKVYSDIDKNNLAAEFIPAKRESDGKPGMYDVVRNRFFVNQGSGEDFTPGEELW